jgi:hypothetical protein
METRKTKPGIDHSDTLTNMANLASTYSDKAVGMRPRSGRY